MFCSFSPLQAERHTSVSKRLALWSHRVLVRAPRSWPFRSLPCACADMMLVHPLMCPTQFLQEMRLDNAGAGSCQIPHNSLSHIKAVLLWNVSLERRHQKKNSRLQWSAQLLINLCFSSLCVPDIVGCLRQRKWKIGFKCFIFAKIEEENWRSNSQSRHVSVKKNTHTEKHYFAFWDAK